MADLPEWVWLVVEATQKYDDEHPVLFREVPYGHHQYQCLDGILEPLIPAEVWQAAQVMRSRRAMGADA